MFKELKERMLNKEPKQQEVRRSVAVINPNEIPIQGSVIEAQQPEAMLEEKQEPTITNLIVSSEALEDGTFRYVMVSTAIYSIGPVEVENK